MINIGLAFTFGGKNEIIFKSVVLKVIFKNRNLLLKTLYSLIEFRIRERG
jgi:hypothetical protein